MRAELLAVDPEHPAPGVVERAGAILRAGGLVVIPTETVYGLAANALDAQAVARIYAAKGRPSVNPLIVHLAEADEVDRVARSVPPLARALMHEFWPGPCTLVLPRQAVVPDIVSAGLDTVGVRVPALAVTRAVIRAAGVPLAAPSANRYTQLSPTEAKHVVEQLGDVVDLILDAGATSVGIESTVVDVTSDPPRLLRPGGISREWLEKITGPLATPGPFDPLQPLPSPGLVARHYAPRTTLQLFSTAERGLMLKHAEGLRGGGGRVVIVLFEDTSAAAVDRVHLPADPERAARLLYATLHELDHGGYDLVLMERPPEGTAWDAVRDRLERGARGR